MTQLRLHGIKEVAEVERAFLEPNAASALSPESLLSRRADHALFPHWMTEHFDEPAGAPGARSSLRGA